MDYSKINFRCFIPEYKKYYDLQNDNPKLNKFVHFSPNNSSLIFYDDVFIGFYKIFRLDEDSNDREIQIAILNEFRKKGIASFILENLSKNIFYSDNLCENIHLFIDKKNIPSIKLAIKLGFNRNEVMEKEIQLYGDKYTFVFSKNREFYIDNYAK